MEKVDVKQDDRVMHFWVKPDVLLNDVYARTSFIGKSKRLEDGRSLLDEISFSHDEAYTLLNPLLSAGGSEIYLLLSRWNSKLPEGYEAYAYKPTEDVNDVEGTKDCLYLAIWGTANTIHAVKAIATQIYEALVNYVMWKWLLLKVPKEAMLYHELYQSNLIAIENAISKMSFSGIGQVKRHIY